MQVATPGFPEIFSSTSPEEYEYRPEWLVPGDAGKQVGEKEVVFIDSEGDAIGWVHAEPAHDAVGTSVPTTVRLVEGGSIVLTVHHREGNPAADWAPFVYPITQGIGWLGGFTTVVVPMENPFAESERKIIEANPPATLEPLPVIDCKVPTLRGYSLRGAKNRLRAAHCGIGAIRLAAEATLGKGKVVKQFHPAGTELAAGASVALKLGVGR
jgi:PASTA domain